MTNIACNLYQMIWQKKKAMRNDINIDLRFISSFKHALYSPRFYSLLFLFKLHLTRYVTAVWFELSVLCNDQIINCGESNGGKKTNKKKPFKMIFYGWFQLYSAALWIFPCMRRARNNISNSSPIIEESTEINMYDA